MKVIQTVYDGYLFRSRLEARWAVFFNSLGINWEYEKEGYKLDGTGRGIGTVFYLPDFWLPNICGRFSVVPGSWLEIKGYEPIEIEEHKCILLGEQINGLVYLAIGIPVTSEIYGSGLKDYSSFYDGQTFCKCYHCGNIKIDQSLENNPCEKCGGQTDDQHSDIKQAIVAVRQARFEHGNKKQ